MTSPGSSGVTRDSCSISSGTLKIISLVRAFCTWSPLIEQPSSRLSGSANSSGVTRYGPIGPKPGKDLPMLNCCGAVPDSCRTRSETSWPTARPAPWDPGRHVDGLEADDDHELDFPVGVAAGRQRDVRVRPGDAGRELREHRRGGLRLGQPGLGHVVRVG